MKHVIQGATSQLSEAVISRFTLICRICFRRTKNSFCDLNNLNTITDYNIRNLINYSKNLNTSFPGINFTLLQMINLLKLAHDINTKLKKTKKYSSMTKDIVLSSIVYYSVRGLLDNRESTILKRLCDITSLENPHEK